MKAGSPPLRFLVLLLGGWTGIRIAMIQGVDAPPESERRSPARAVLLPRLIPKAAASPFATSPTAASLKAFAAATARPQPYEGNLVLEDAATIRGASMPSRPASDSRAPSLTSAAPETDRKPAPLDRPAPSVQPAAPQLSALAPLQMRTGKRLSAEAWLLIRQGRQASLAAGGMLGGSQAGARILYRVAGSEAAPLSLSARAYAPLNNVRGAEAAVGVEWQPAASLPVRILAEHREAVGKDGRSAFALLAHGGVSRARLVGPVDLDAYAQAGIVGARRRDAFVDGSAVARVTVAERPEIGIGLGIWGAAQTGIARLDAGPQVSALVSVGPALFRLAVDYRVRVAGDAAPGSGPAVTLSTAF